MENYGRPLTVILKEILKVLEGISQKLDRNACICTTSTKHNMCPVHGDHHYGRWLTRS